MPSSLQMLATRVFFFAVDRVFSYCSNSPLTSLWSALSKAVASCGAGALGARARVAEVLLAAVEARLAVVERVLVVAVAMGMSFRGSVREQRDEDDDGQRNAEEQQEQ